SAAAVMLGGHLPYVWDMKGPTLDKIADEVKQWLAGKGMTATAAFAPLVGVKSGVEGADRVVVDVQVANGGDLLKAQVALSQLKATGGRDPKRALSFAHVRSVSVRVRAAGSGPVTVDLAQAAAPQSAATPPPGRRPGGGAKENLDLSSFYSIDGAFADTDNN